MELDNEKEYRYALLIAPSRNWNFSYETLDKVKQLSFNRTIKELKPNTIEEKIANLIAFNRTIKELKHFLAAYRCTQVRHF